MPLLKSFCPYNDHILCHKISHAAADFVFRVSALRQTCYQMAKSNGREPRKSLAHPAHGQHTVNVLSTPLSVQGVDGLL